MSADDQKKKFLEFLPVLSYLIVYFLLQSFDWMEATKIVLGVIASLVTFLVMSSIVKDDYDINETHIKRLNFQIGFLSLFFILIFVSGFLSWYRMVSNLMRFAVTIVLLIIYLVILFRSMRILSEIKQRSQKKKKK